MTISKLNLYNCWLSTKKEALIEKFLNQFFCVTLSLPIMAETPSASKRVLDEGENTEVVTTKKKKSKVAI